MRQLCNEKKLGEIFNHAVRNVDIIHKEAKYINIILKTTCGVKQLCGSLMSNSKETDHIWTGLWNCSQQIISQIHLYWMFDPNHMIEKTLCLITWPPHGSSSYRLRVASIDEGNI